MSIIKSNILLLLAAVIWGLAFVAQRVGMDFVGPFTFNGVRFMLGSLSLLPLLWYLNRGEERQEAAGQSALLPGLLAGLILFAGASLQQVALVYTTAGKAAFITCLYIVLVPLMGAFIGHKIGKGTWLGCFLALAGLYLLCIKENLTIQRGDMLALIGAFFWAFHILIIGRYSRRVDPIKLSFTQFLVCSLLSLAVAAFKENIALSSLQAGIVPILYAGICSVGIAYTLQVVGQKHAPAAHAAIILSMESAFAVIGGYFILGETMDVREIAGCLLMFAGMLVSQLQSLDEKKD